MDPTEFIPSVYSAAGPTTAPSDLAGFLLDQFPHGVFLFQGHRLAYLNSRAAEILGRSVEELRSLESLEPLVFSGDRGLFSDWFARLLSGSANQEIQLFRVVHRDTSLRRVMGSAARVLHKGIPGILGLFCDVTEWAESQREAERARRLDMVGRVADSLGNDLNNLLSSVLGNASLLRESPLAQGAVADQLLEIETGALQCAELVARLLHTSTRRPMLPRAMNLNDAVSRAATVLRSTTARHIDLRVRLASEPKPMAGDPALVEQVVLHLGLNACEAMPQGGVVTLDTEEVALDAGFCRIHSEVEPGPHLRLRVEDTGRGIAPEVLDQVFDPFFTTRQNVRGAGVGLTLCHNIVAMHGGCLEIRSWLGQGTCVSAYFPCLDPALEKEKARIEGVATGHGSILIIDDEELARSTARRILRRHGYSVLEASRGEDGLTLVKEAPASVDLVLLDLIMPGLSGRQTLEQLRAFAPSVPVVLISGHSLEVLDPEFERLRVHHLVRKPYRPTDLVQVIQSALGSAGAGSGPTLPSIDS